MAKKKTVKKKTAKKKVVKKAVRRRKPVRKAATRALRRHVVTIREITDALYGIENWCRALREILLLLPPDMTIMLPTATARGSAGGGVPQGLDYGCPPPPPADGSGLDYGCPPPPPAA